MVWSAQRLLLRPGAREPIAGMRMPLAERLLRGRLAALAPTMLGSLYALCGQAHRLCAEMALQVVQRPTGTGVQPHAAQRLALWRETLQEHVRRMYLDWPRLLGSTAHGVPRLVASPALAQEVRPGDGWLTDWLAQQVLGMPLAQWQQACQHSPHKGLRQWVHEVDNLHTQALRRALPWAVTWQLPLQTLPVDGQGEALVPLAEGLLADADFARLPHVQGQWRETGCWSRAADPALVAADVWSRLAARVCDLVALAQPQGELRLSAGARSLGAGQAVAWCEMARGLLVHWLCVDAQGRVERYGVLAPTEWNFHPQGPVAQVLQRLPQQVPPEEWASAVGVLVASFDPCVDFSCCADVGRQEAAHA